MRKILAPTTPPQGGGGAISDQNAPVNSRENPNNLRILANRPCIHDRMATAPDSPKIAYALYASFPRRAARPASGFGSRGPACGVHKGGARAEGTGAM